MGMLLQHLGPLLARLLLTPLFFYSAFRKFDALGATAVRISTSVVNQLGLDIVSAHSILWRGAAAAAGLIEILGAILILIGWRTRAGAMLLLAYLLAVTALFHLLPWMNTGDPQVAVRESLQVFKNMGLMAGLLLFATHGPGRFSVDRRG
jgi:putative oxidoreductase